MGGGLVKVLVVAAVGCSGAEAPEDPNTQPGPEAGVGSSAGTRVTGSLGNNAFVLQHAAIKRATDTDPRNWICVANVPLSFAQCEQSGGPDRTMFLGPFVYDQDVPRWALVQVGLYRVGDNARSASGKSGTLEISRDDPAGPFEMTFTVDFGETPATSGTIAIQ